ncbi:MAG: hypothetical protein EOO03_05455 [Chitinophagaceae bacterium]|nr:MAG: hypothetical protein EOO03_05455 [Chitinophagaceae bacterium]
MYPLSIFILSAWKVQLPTHPLIKKAAAMMATVIFFCRSLPASSFMIHTYTPNTYEGTNIYKNVLLAIGLDKTGNLLLAKIATSRGANHDLEKAVTKLSSGEGE